MPKLAKTEKTPKMMVVSADKNRAEHYCIGAVKVMRDKHLADCRSGDLGIMDRRSLERG
jgi:hypothetical protein